MADCPRLRRHVAFEHCRHSMLGRGGQLLRERHARRLSRPRHPHAKPRWIVYSSANSGIYAGRPRGSSITRASVARIARVTSVSVLVSSAFAMRAMPMGLRTLLPSNPRQPSCRDPRFQRVKVRFQSMGITSCNIGKGSSLPLRPLAWRRAMTGMRPLQPNHATGSSGGLAPRAAIRVATTDPLESTPNEPFARRRGARAIQGRSSKYFPNLPNRRPPLQTSLTRNIGRPAL